MKGKSTAEDLRGAGLRGTRQRITLLSLLRASSRHMSIEELVRRGRGEFDMATAYRILDTFTKVGLVKRSALIKGRATYEASSRHHHHAVCRSCGRIVDIEACVPRMIDARVRKTAGFATIDDHALEFFGLCTACSRKRSS